jgi:hypothetical protein
LGRLAKISGDSDKCIVTTVKFYKDPNRKLEIMIGALDSTCIRILQEKKLDTDSTDRFVFGKLPNALY